MNQPQGESGLELVLDNRKLIIGFVVLMGICAAFFLFGFVEGKRQAVREISESASGPSAAPQAETKGFGSEKGKAIEDRPVREQLDFYKKLNKKGPDEKKPEAVAALPQVAKKSEPISAPPPQSVPKAPPAPAAASAETMKKAPQPAKNLEPVPAAAAEKIAYTVQVGAFKDRREAEKKAETLKTKGYEFSINPVANGLFGLQVGQFESKADAFAMQLRLKKDGFPTLIKTR